MNAIEIRNLLIWCTVFDFAILLAWFAMFTLAGDWLYRLHGKWFPMSKETFGVVHYCGMAVFKVAILVFNLVPLVALLIVR